MSHNYLDYIRELNRVKASKCYICQKESEYMDCIEARVVYVCLEHKIHEDALIADIPRPNYFKNRSK